MRKINCLLLSLLFLLCVAPTSLFAQPMRIFKDSEQRYVYDVSYKQIGIGKLLIDLQQKGQAITANTRADLSFLFYRLTGNQLSHLYWDDTAQSFISERFVRNINGFAGKNVQAYFFNSGHQTKVISDGKNYEFSNAKEPILDFNAISLQIREGLKQGQTHFDFYMQTSDSVAHYYFEVTGKEVIQSKFGKLESYRLEQTHKPNRTFIAWFSPEINYQMVKFYYKFNLLDLRGVLTEHSSNDL